MPLEQLAVKLKKKDSEETLFIIYKLNHQLEKQLFSLGIFEEFQPYAMGGDCFMGPKFVPLIFNVSEKVFAFLKV